MKTSHICAAFLLSLASSTSAFAAATAEEAARIQATFQSYLGSEPGVVTVTPAGEGYDVALDPAPYFKKVTTPDFKASADPYRFNATPKGNGQWAVTSNGPYKISTSVPNIFSFDFAAANIQWSGTYSDALLAFLDQKVDASGITMSQVNIDPTSKMKTSSVTAVEKMSAVLSSKDAGNGTLDGTSTYEMSGVISSSTMEAPPGDTSGIGFAYVANAERAGFTTNSKGMTTKPLLELLAFFVARPSKELLVKDQQQLKDKLTSALPVFATIDGSGSYQNVVIDTGLGKFQLGNLGGSVNMNGVTKTGRFAESIDVNNFKLPEGLPLPPWSKGLVPTSIKLGFDFSGFDLEAPSRKFIAEMDITKTDPVPPGSEAAYLAAFAPTNTIKMTIPPGQISSDLYTLTYEGTSDINLSGAPPAVNMTLTMKGLDQVIAQLQQAAADPTAQQGMAMLFAVKGIGKLEGDITKWEITMSQDGKLLINGTDMSAMMGAIAPPAQPPAQ
jgi:hypothetical protein